MAPGQNYGDNPAQGSYPQQQGYGQAPAYPEPQVQGSTHTEKPKKSGVMRKVGAILTMLGIVLIGVSITIMGVVVISENKYQNDCLYPPPGANPCTGSQMEHQVTNANNETSFVLLIIGIGVTVLGVGIGLLALTRPFSRMDS